MEYPRPRRDTMNTISARPVISEEVGAWAEEAVIVKRLDHGDAGGMARGIGSRRHQREGIVEMCDLRLIFSNRVPDARNPGF